MEGGGGGEGGKGEVMCVCLRPTWKSAFVVCEKKFVDLI